MSVDVALVENYIVLGFGLSMIVFFIGQSLRLLIDVVDTMIKR
jgi:hypothetical protein